VRAIDAAFRLYILPQGIFSVAISTVLFPSIARMVARRDSAGVRAMVTSGIRQIVFMLVPASLFLMVLAEPITRLTFQRGNFDSEATSLTSQALLTFTVGLVFNGASLLLLRTFFSLQMPWLTTKVAALGFVVNIVLDAVFYVPFGVSGIPLATSIASIVTFCVLVNLLRREVGGLGMRSIVDGFVRCLAAAGVMAVLSWATWNLLDGVLGRSTLAQIVCMIAALGAALVAYLAAARAFEVPELRQLGSLIRPLR
jgi:putative peptidoglycan lipid II flippase